MTYVMSDIHGNLRRFQSVMGQISLQPNDTLYVLGDVIDRHPHGIDLLRQLMAMTNVKMLLGNHEYIMLRALGEPYDGPEDTGGTAEEVLLEHWYDNGGRVTRSAWLETPKAVQADVIDWLKALPLNFDVTVNGQWYKLVHAAPVELYYRFQREGLETQTHFAVWDRNAVLCNCDADYTTVFGHTPTRKFQNADPLQIWHYENLLGIDCGSGFPEPSDLPPGAKRGRLGCLRLEDMAEYYSDED